MHPLLIGLSLATGILGRAVDGSHGLVRRWNSSISNPDACGEIVAASNQNGTVVFDAGQIYQCLESTPFYAGNASAFIKYISDTLQFQSTVELLISPPTSYKEPAVDLQGFLLQIQQEVNTPGFFANEYAFEKTVQELIYTARDAHLDISAGVLSAFQFGSPYELVSLSLDGKQLPKIYLYGRLTIHSESMLTV
jgi:hypothetical protein